MSVSIRINCESAVERLVEIRRFSILRSSPFTEYLSKEFSEKFNLNVNKRKNNRLRVGCETAISNV